MAQVPGDQAVSPEEVVPGPATSLDGANVSAVAAGPTSLDERRVVLMREAAADMEALPPGKRTLDEFERRTAEKAERNGWDRAGFARQHLRNNVELKAIFQAARFPDRPAAVSRPPRGAKGESREQLLERLASVAAERDLARKECKEARQRVEQSRLDNAAELVREFIAAMGLTPKAPPKTT